MVITIHGYFNSPYHSNQTVFFSFFKFYFIFTCSKIHIIKFTIFAIFKCIVQYFYVIQFLIKCDVSFEVTVKVITMVQDGLDGLKLLEEEQTTAMM